jgi:hypothetical protein
MGLDSRSRATVISCADRCIRRSGGTLRSGVSPAAMPRWAGDARSCVSAGNVCDARAQGNLCAPISVDYRRPSRRATISPVARGCSAVGSASPCQGEGRGFESRHPLEVQSHQSPRWSGRVVRQRPAKPCTRVRFPSPPPTVCLARLAQRESASLTRKRSLVQSQYRAPVLPQFRPGFYRAFAVSAQ